MLSAVLAIPLGLADAALYFKAYENAKEFFSLLGFRWDLATEALEAVLETFVISLFGVALGGLVALPVASMATPPPLVASPRLSWAVRWVSSAVRSIPAVLWAVFS